ncbi:MAG: hypothetical protein JKY89_06940, partial [Immundisolibacteraceae bacterium]|nr:hypothetical protein [Immundisolibacteraceae bacterium]
MTPVNITLFLLIAIIVLLLLKIWQLRPNSTNSSGPFAQLDSNLVADALCDGYFDVDLTSGHYQVSDSWLLSIGFDRAELPA